MSKQDFQLRDFIYLDTGKIRSFAAVIQGGLAREVSDRIKELGDLSGGLKVGALQIGASLDATKTKEHERDQTMEITDPVLFDGVYRALKEKGLKRVSDLTAPARNQLAVGDFIEVQGMASPPVLESWLDRMRQMTGMLRRYSDLITPPTPQSQGRSNPKQKGPASSTDNAMISQFEALVEILADFTQLARRDPGKEYVRIEVGNQGVLWCGLLPEFIVTSRGDFSTRATVVGQIESVLQPKEEWKLVDLSAFSDEQSAAKLISALNSMPMAGKAISESDLVAKYPDIIVRPIAIFH